MEKFTSSGLVYLAISDQPTFEHLMFRCEKLKESINKVADACIDAQKSFEKFKIAAQKAKRTEMYKRHFNKKRA